MRRLVPIAAFVVFLALPLWAQHGGGGHGGFGGGHGGGGFGGHAGFSGGHVSSGAHFASGGARGFSGSRGYSRPSFSRPLAQGSFSNRGFANRGYSSRGFSNRPFLHDGYRGVHIRTYGLRNCYGYPCRGYGYGYGYGYPWAYGGYYDPFWWGDSNNSSYDDDYERDRAIANDMNEQSLEEQQMMRQEQADGDRDAYARPARTQSDDPPGAAIFPATVLIFRDQHKLEVQNYAIVGQTLWNFAPQHTQKIPLSDLDLTATAKANDERGLTFRLPTNGEAQ